MPEDQPLQIAVLDCLSEIEQLVLLLNNVSDAAHKQRTCSEPSHLSVYLAGVAFATRSHRVRITRELEQCRL